MTSQQDPYTINASEPTHDAFEPSRLRPVSEPVYGSAEATDSHPTMEINVAEVRKATLRPFAPEASYEIEEALPEDDGVVREDSAEVQPVSQSGSLIAREIIETFLLTLLIFWAVNTMTGRFRIEGSSMMPTMQEGEYVLINKLAYYLEDPKRGDIIVLHYPRDPSRDFIKRVIGVPGDTVDIENGQVTVNGQIIDEPYINSAPSYNGNWTVPDDQYFVLGDNRNNSSDSHTWGFLPRDHIVGKGWVVYWPVDQMERIPHYTHPLETVWDTPFESVQVINQ